MINFWLDSVIQASGMLLLFYGLWEMGNNKLRGPFITGIAEVLTFTVGIVHHTWSIWIIGLVLSVVQFRNYLKWRKEDVNW